MRNNTVAHFRLPSREWFGALATAGLSALGVAGCVWLDLVIWPATALGLALVIGGTHYLYQARAERRWRAALDRYGEMQQTWGTQPRRDSWR